ncbi:MAG: DUF166 family protein [Chloroflexota bacterium]|nr:DUF166 family protein [Chloroflexota bacterium]
MPTRRVFILASQPLFAQGVESLLSGQSDISVVGTALVGPDAFDQLSDAAPDVIIIEAEGAEEQRRLVTKSLARASHAKIIGLTPDDNRISIFYQQMKESRQVSDLLEEIVEPLSLRGRGPSGLRLFVLHQGHYGERILEHIRRFAPTSWSVDAWRGPSDLPPIVDAPRTFLPLDLPGAHLVLSLGQVAGLAQLVPSVVQLTDARSVIVPVDNAAWLPDGLTSQLHSQLAEAGVTAVFPKPFCSLTQDSYSLREHRVSYDDPWIAEFARHFGRPVLHMVCETGRITDIEVKRDTACGSARAVARELIGMDVDEAVQQAGLLHHHSPCSAAMRVDPSLGEPLIQIAGGLMRQAVEDALDTCLSQEGHRMAERHTINSG